MYPPRKMRVHYPPSSNAQPPNMALVLPKLPQEPLRFLPLISSVPAVLSPVTLKTIPVFLFKVLPRVLQQPPRVLQFILSCPPLLPPLTLQSTPVLHFLPLQFLAPRVKHRVNLCPGSATATSLLKG